MRAPAKITSVPFSFNLSYRNMIKIIPDLKSYGFRLPKTNCTARSSLFSSNFLDWFMGVHGVRIRRIWLPILAAIAMVAPLAGQDASAPKPDAGHITGTVIDAGGDTLSGATVILRSPNLKAPRSILSDDNGSFEFRDLDSGTYQVTVTAPDFADWTKTDINLDAGQFLILTDIKMHIAKTVSTVTVNGSSVEVASEQVKIEEQQRLFGIIPNFYVVYDPNPVPLTTKLKFQLALKTSADPFTIAGVGVLAAINQAGNTPDYVQGWKGYGERAGAAAADGFSDIMLGGAILPARAPGPPSTTIRAQAQTGRARSTRFPVHSFVREIMDTGNPTSQAWVAI